MTIEENVALLLAPPEALPPVPPPPATGLKLCPLTWAGIGLFTAGLAVDNAGLMTLGLVVGIAGFFRLQERAPVEEAVSELYSAFQGFGVGLQQNERCIPCDLY